MSLCTKIEMSLCRSYNLLPKGGTDGSSWGDDHDERRGVEKGVHSETGDEQTDDAEEGSRADRSVVPAGEKVSREGEKGGRPRDHPQVEGEEREQENIRGSEGKGDGTSS